MIKLGIREEDLVERFIRGTGAGGQKRNKTSSAVQLSHTSSGIEVRCQATRSQGLNRFHARRELCERIEEQVLGLMRAAIAEQEKIRRQKRRRSRRQKQKLVADKRKRGEVKKDRRRPSND
jgi:protein subunit release factor B